jgi:hypothetical protein
LRNVIFEYKSWKKEVENALKTQQVEKAEKDGQSLAGEDLLKPHKRKGANGDRRTVVGSQFKKKALCY